MRGRGARFSSTLHHCTASSADWFAPDRLGRLSLPEPLTVVAVVSLAAVLARNVSSALFVGPRVSCRMIDLPLLLGRPLKARPCSCRRDASWREQWKWTAVVSTHALSVLRGSST